MCFSAGASFGAASILGVVGAVTVKRADQRSEWMFSCIPFLFAIQQASEGFVWLSLTRQNYASNASALIYIFLFLAQVIWPIWIPLSVWLLELSKPKKKILVLLLGGGIICSGLLAYRLIYYPVSAQVLQHHISYEMGSQVFISSLNNFLYPVVVILPLFISSIKYMKILGVLLVLSLLFSKIFYEEHFISVWCFFAALLSVAILYILVRKNQGQENVLLNSRIHRFPHKI